MATPTLLGAFYILVFFCTEGQPRYAHPTQFVFAFCFAWLLTEAWYAISQVSQQAQALVGAEPQRDTMPVR